MPLPAFLLPETTVQQNGSAEPIALTGSRPLLVTLGITQVVEQQSLLLSIEGSDDGTAWQPDPVVTFPEKFYTGVSLVYIDPAIRNIHHIRASWKVNRWGRGDKTPSFRIYIFVENV